MCPEWTLIVSVPGERFELPTNGLQNQLLQLSTSSQKSNSYGHNPRFHLCYPAATVLPIVLPLPGIPNLAIRSSSGVRYVR